jgi:hypothetical protein
MKCTNCKNYFCDKCYGKLKQSKLRKDQWICRKCNKVYDEKELRYSHRKKPKRKYKKRKKKGIELDKEHLEKFVEALKKGYQGGFIL